MRETLGFFTPAAFRFYLPAYMMVSLDPDHEAEADIIPEYTVFDLTPPVGERDNVYGWKYFLEKMNGFTESQKQAIRSYLRYMEVVYPDLFAGSFQNASQALHSFWKI